MNLIQLSWKNLVGKPLNLLLTLLLFALGVGMVSFLLNLNQQIEKNFEKNLAGVDLVIGAKGSPLQQILCSMYHVDNPTGNIPMGKCRPFLNPKHPLIGLAVPLSLGDNFQGYRIAGTTYDIIELYGATMAEGSLWANPMEVTLGATVAATAHLHVGDRFKSSHGLVDGLEEHEHDFTVVGILKPTGSVIDQLVLTPPESIWESHDHSETSPSNSDHTAETHSHDHAHEHKSVAPTTYDSLTIRQLATQQRLGLMAQADSVEITSILVRFRSRTNYQSLQMGRNVNENTDLMAASPPNEIARLQTNLGLGADALKMLAWVIVFVSGLSIFISLFSSLKERKYELALLRVMGGSPVTLFNLIVLEGLLLAAIGYCLGILLSHLGLAMLSVFMKDAYRYSFSGSQFLTAELYLLGGALLVGFVAALIPAVQASRTDISHTLKG